MESVHNILDDVLNNYTDYRKQPLKENPLLNLFCHRFRDALIGSIPELSDPEKYTVKGSIQMGRWCDVFWMMVAKNTITRSATKGVYIVYLVSTDGSACYLTLGQSATSGTKGSIPLADSTKIIQNMIGDLSPFSFDKPNLGPKISTSRHKEEYEDGCICYKKYGKGALPLDAVFVADLKQMMSIYDVYESEAGSFQHLTAAAEKEEKKDANTVKDTIEKIKNYIAFNGFSYPSGLIENFYLSLKAKPFVILAGVSGTGKTKLVKLFAEAVGATSENGRYLLVPVRPDWSDSSDLLGHTDLKGRFVPGAIIDFIAAANKDLDHPYFLCLDEMNLARVEYYFSDVLSIMETRKRVSSTGRIESDRLIPRQLLGDDAAVQEKYGGLILPENLYIIGTVNMDETTFPFSKKVLDRANMIEFSEINLEYGYKGGGEISLAKPAPLDLQNDFFVANYLTLDDFGPASEKLIGYCKKLEAINEILAGANMQVGYRVRDEAVFYQLYNDKGNLIPTDQAFDNVLMQKVLPRVQGGSGEIRKMLCELFANCFFEDDIENKNKKDWSVMELDKIKPDSKLFVYPKTAQKITYMIRRFQEDGFTSYWL